MRFTQLSPQTSVVFFTAWGVDALAAVAPARPRPARAVQAARDTAAFLMKVDHHATLPRNIVEREIQLFPAIAAQRSEHVASQTLGVNAHEWRSGMYLAHNQCHRFFGLGAVARRRRSGGKSMDQEMPPASREVRRRNVFYL